MAEGAVVAEQLVEVTERAEIKIPSQLRVSTRLEVPSA